MTTSTCPAGTGYFSYSASLGTLENYVTEQYIGQYIGAIADDGECITCTTGKASSESNPFVCEVCQKGEHWETVSLCRDCPTGFQNQNIDDTCTECEVGKYSGIVGTEKCLVCNAGYITAETAQSSCKACPKGTKLTTTAQGGASYHDNIDDCVACAIGKYNDLEGNSEEYFHKLSIFVQKQTSL